MSRDDGKLTIREYFSKTLHGNESGLDGRVAKALKAVNLFAPMERIVNTFSGTNSS